MRRQYIIFFTLIGSLLLYTAYKLHQSLNVSVWMIFPFMLPLFFLMFGSLLISRANQKINEKRWFQLYVSFGTVFIGLWGSYIIFSLMTDLAKIVILGSYKIFQTDGLYDTSLTQSFHQTAHYTLPISFAIVIFGFIEVLRGPVVKSVSVERENISRDIHQLKIAQISDLHIGASIRAQYVSKVIRRTNRLEADVIVITGDLIDGDPRSIQHVTDMLSQLKAKHGVYYVVGNHEYYWGIEDVLTGLRNTGMHLLLNENKIIQIGETKLLISGITDPAARTMQPSRPPDITKASLGMNQADFKILLAHQPSVYPHAEKLKYDLQLSGHTHAGQFFPFSLFIGFAHKYSRGLYLYKDMHVYVNPGTGYWGPANRFGIPAEITLIELKQI